MERALFLESGDRLPAAGAWDRVYVGSEFCPWLLPGPDELARTLEGAARSGLEVSLATPWLTDESLAAVARLLEAARGSGLELVVNDWGLLDLVRSEEWPFPLALGRLLVHCSAGPAAEPRRAAEYLAGSSLSSPEFVAFLGSVGIGRAEIDDPAHRVAAPLAFSLHWPQRYVTLAARCPWRRDGRGGEAGPCPAPCRGREFTMRRSSDGLEILVRQRAQLLPGAVSPREDVAGVDRLVEHRAREGRP